MYLGGLPGKQMGLSDLQKGKGELLEADRGDDRNDCGDEALEEGPLDIRSVSPLTGVNELVPADVIDIRLASMLSSIMPD